MFGLDADPWSVRSPGSGDRRRERAAGAAPDLAHSLRAVLRAGRARVVGEARGPGGTDDLFASARDTAALATRRVRSRGLRRARRVASRAVPATARRSPTVPRRACSSAATSTSRSRALPRRSSSQRIRSRNESAQCNRGSAETSADRIAGAATRRARRARASGSLVVRTLRSEETRSTTLAANALRRPRRSRRRRDVHHALRNVERKDLIRPKVRSDVAIVDEILEDDRGSCITERWSSIRLSDPIVAAMPSPSGVRTCFKPGSARFTPSFAAKRRSIMMSRVPVSIAHNPVLAVSEVEVCKNADRGVEFVLQSERNARGELLALRQRHGIFDQQLALAESRTSR